MSWRKEKSTDYFNMDADERREYYAKEDALIDLPTAPDKTIKLVGTPQGNKLAEWLYNKFKEKDSDAI